MNDAIRIIRILLGNHSSVTRGEIEEQADIVLNMPKFNGINRQQFIREVESIYNIRVDDFRIIALEERHLPWLSEKRTQITWSFWERYRSYLQDEKGFAPEVINKLDKLSDRILDSLYDPSANIQIDKKGLVVGQVQSGKTSNYTGLICKAADAGFNIIIVLTGIHENLRSQTQLRLDEGFLGFDTKKSRAYDTSISKIGVSKFSKEICVAHSLTSSENKADFNRNKANTLGINFDTSDPLLIVTKKNKSILDNLSSWLESQIPSGSENLKIQNKSLLLIDDEADNASINVSNDPEKRSAINDRITKIISLFRKSGYVGYTATPFANIFIPLEEDNLFPRDFIINIPAPSNYIGPDKVFGFEMIEEGEENYETVLPIVNRIDDHAHFVPDKHKKDDQLPSSIPETLKLAIRCFILTCAIRRLRGQKKTHNSMLIHVSRFQRWQRHIKELVENVFDYYRRGIDQNDDKIIELFQSTFEDNDGSYKSFKMVSEQIIESGLSDIDPHIQVHDWNDVLRHLNDAVSRIEVREIHGGSGDVLDYYDHNNGLSVIAVGGNKLSRGLTLEGLSVSYYLRASRMYDTLMQMGRWFGYRHGYVDLCRLFTSRELNEWFCHITHASEELREEFDYMSDVAGATPEQYALKVRTHPGVLQISAANKLKTAINVQVTWAGRLVESYEFKKDLKIINNNLKNTKDFISKLPGNYKQKNDNYLWFNITTDEVINLLNGMITPQNLKAYDPQNLVQFIDKQLVKNELTSWRVALMNKKNSSRTEEFIISGKSVSAGTYTRRQDDNNSDNEIYYLRKSHIISPKDEFIDLTEEEYERAMELTGIQRKRNNKPGEPDYPNGEIVRNQIRSPQNPLLLIYTLDPVASETGLPEGASPFIGYAISFPFSRFSEYVTYAVNEELLDKFNVVEEDFDDYGDED